MGDEPASQSNVNNDFERMRKTLQDAASFAQAQPSQENKLPYNAVNVLLLRWEDDIDSDNDLQALKKMFAERYNYNTDTFTLPTSEDAESKLSSEITKHIENTTQGTLLVIYYTGHTMIGSEKELYWAWYGCTIIFIASTNHQIATLEVILYE